MASMRDIKRRKSSISSTQQITKAMKLVSTVKLQKAKGHAEQANPYFNYMYQTVTSMLAKSGSINHPYLTGKDSGQKAVIVITSNRGLAGGYNANVVKLITESDLPKDKLSIYAVGNKGRESLEHKGYSIVKELPELIETPAYDEASALAREVLAAYEKGEVGEIYLAYTHFKNTVVHEPKLIKLLPVDIEDMPKQEEDNVLMNYEPNQEEALNLIIPKYVTSLLYGALVEAVASENGARMQAMGVFSANEFLTRNNLMKAFRDDYDTPIKAGKKVVVVGGGNVAMDAARTAKRLGAEVHIVYRRGEEELPARKEEIHHAKEEGIIFDLLQNPTEILVDEDGWVKGCRVIKMELGEPDASGRRSPVEIPGSEYEIEADTVIMSLGTSPNPLISSTTKGLDINRRKCIIAEEETGATSKDGVYAGGDAVTGAATVILAMGAGKTAAKGIDEFLRNK